MSATNSKSRQRLVRVPLDRDDWLQSLARKSRAKDPDYRGGVATEINKLIDAAYEKDQKPAA